MPKSPNVCEHCGEIIVLRKSGLHYKWFSGRKTKRGGTARFIWKCPAPGFPVRSHSPKDKSNA